MEWLTLLLPGLMDVIKRVIPDPATQAQVQAEITKHILDNQAAAMQSMKDVMVADSQSESWMTRNARPSVVYWCLGAMSWLMIAPMFDMASATIEALTAIPDNLWNVMLVGIGGYTLAKGGEGIAKTLKGK